MIDESAEPDSADQPGNEVSLETIDGEVEVSLGGRVIVRTGSACALAGHLLDDSMQVHLRKCSPMTRV